MVDLIFEQPDVDFGRNFAALAERDIDFLLLEEFQVNEDFVHWFCGEIGLLGIEPGGAWHSVFDAEGETDLLVRIYQGKDKIGILNRKQGRGRRAARAGRTVSCPWGQDG